MTQSAGPKEEDVFSLVIEAKKGNAESLQRLLEHPVVMSRASIICQRIVRRSTNAGYYRDAEDLRQELFFSFCQNLERFRCEHGEASFWKFCEILARNIHLSQVRKSKRETQQSEEKAVDELPSPSEQNQHHLLSIRNAVASLDDREKYVLMRRLAGEGLVEIAANAPFEMTKSTAHRLLRSVQRKFMAHVDGCKDPATSKRSRN